MKTTMRISLLLAAVVALIAVRATTAGPADPFPHKIHLEEVDDCGMCHGPDKDGAMTVKAAACSECHDEDVPAYRKVTGGGHGILRFPHALHVDAAACKDCHKAPVMKASREKKSCDACHAKNDVDVQDSGCARCHGKPAEKLVPPDHEGTWKVSHGKAAQWRVFDRHGKDCSTCHKTGTCQVCHMEESPRSHTGLWRIRTHGRAASWDRDSCRTCHETGSCESCHRTSPPLNHVGAWSKLHGLTARSKADISCGVCHEAGTCAACHAGK
ncbi:MAG: cytochrome c3 family protein [Pseudomonadota bacterium]